MARQGARQGEAARPANRSNPRTRLDPQVRRGMILKEAVSFFAQHGFEAQTKELARRLGVSQGLIFRYFGTKQALVEEVYNKVFLERWSTSWEELLRDRTQPLAARIERFYLSYFSAVDEHEWIRISLYAGLAGHDIIARYIQTRVNLLLEVIARELRVHKGEPEDASLDPLEYELVWHLHSTFIYFLVRKYVHHLPVLDDREAVVARIVANFLHEAGAAKVKARTKATAKAGAKAAPPAKPARTEANTAATPTPTETRARVPSKRGARAARVAAQ